MRSFFLSIWEWWCAIPLVRRGIALVLGGALTLIILSNDSDRDLDAYELAGELMGCILVMLSGVVMVIIAYRRGWRPDPKNDPPKHDWGD